jgi:glucokinase
MPFQSLEPKNPEIIMLLAGDIGGTKTVLALFDGSGGELVKVREATFPSRDYATFQMILDKFLAGEARSSLRAGCFGVAGAVIEGKCKTTNLPWVLDESELGQATGAARVRLLNDLEAMAFGMLYLRPDEVYVVQAGWTPKRKGNIAVIAAGTGLGEAMLFWDGERYHPVASEGGHADFAPQSDEQIGLLRYLRDQCGGHVSCERVLSGPGLHHIYSFLRDTGRFPEPTWLAEQLKKGDPSAVISQLGIDGEDPLCAAAVDLFCYLYGAEAGNLALKCFAIGGVYLGGGIAPKSLTALVKGSFLRGFNEKGRFDEFMKEIEVSVALNPHTPLIGAAHFALRL